MNALGSLADVIQILPQVLMGALTVAVAMMAASVTIIAVVIAIMRWQFSETILTSRIEKQTNKILIELEERIAPLEGRMFMELAEYFRLTRTETEPEGRKLTIDYSIKGLSRFRWARTPDRELIKQILGILFWAVPPAGALVSTEDLKGMQNAFDAAAWHLGIIDDDLVRDDISEIHRFFIVAIRQSMEKDAKKS